MLCSPAISHKMTPCTVQGCEQQCQLQVVCVTCGPSLTVGTYKAWKVPKSRGAPGLLDLVLQEVDGDGVDGGGQGEAAGDDDGEHADPDRDERDQDEGRRRYRAHHIGPHAAAVHQLHAERQAPLEQGALLRVEHDLEVPLRVCAVVSASASSARLICSARVQGCSSRMASELAREGLLEAGADSACHF